MTLMRRFTSVLRWILRRDRAEQQLDDDLRTFVEMAAAERIRDGVAPAEARRQAMLELGGVEQVKEQVRTGRHGAWIDEVGRDVRYAGRMFVRNPGFTVVVVLTLALGIGANTAIFSLIDALLLRSLPVPNASELLQPTLRAPDSQGPGGATFSYAIARALAERSDIFSSAGGFSSLPLEAGPPGSIARIPGAFVTGAFYETLGLEAARGRLLARQDDEPGAAPVAVISFGYWERQFASNPDAIGQTIRLGGVPVTIVGIEPRGFSGANVGSVADVTLPVSALPQAAPSAAPLLGPGNFWLRILARPAAGLSAAQAAERLNAAWPQLAEQVIAAHWPASRRKAMADSRFELSPGATGWSYLREIYRKPLYVLMAVVGLVLLIACANVASLLLARASARQREIAVRLAMGAGRGRIARQLLIESTLLSLTGAAVGIGLAWLSGHLLINTISSSTNPLVFDLTPNWRVLTFTTAVAVTTAILFGVAPALQASGSVPAGAINAGTRLARPRSRLLAMLVSAQVALSLVVLAGAGLFVRTLQNLQNLDPGFTAAGVLVVDIEGKRAEALPELVQSARLLPGVVSASISTHTPLSGSVWSEPAVPAGQPMPERDNAYFIAAAPQFFDTMRTQLVAGRDFTDRDASGSPRVAIINEAFAERYFSGDAGGANPVGQRLTARVRGKQQELEIVGLVRNTKAAGLRKSPPPTVYIPYAQLEGGPFWTTSLVVRTQAPAGRVSGTLRQLVQGRLPDSAIEVRAMDTQVAETIVQERMMATLAGGFGVLALTLACVGLYGLLAYTVAQRTKELGIRLALGAPTTRVIGLVLGNGARLVAIGVVIGVPAAWAGSRAIEAMLFGLTPTDPLTMGGAIVLLTAAAQLAAYLPARRAARVDPLVALRHD